MTKKEKRIDEAIENLREEVTRCKKFEKRDLREGGYLRAYEAKSYCDHSTWVLDQIEYYLEEGRMP
jgi:hypothetical protein